MNINEKLVKLIGIVFIDCDLFLINEVYWIKNGDSIDIQGSGGWFFIDNYDFIIKNVGQDDVGDYRFIVFNLVGLIISEVIVFGMIKNYIFFQNDVRMKVNNLLVDIFGKKK